MTKEQFLKIVKKEIDGIKEYTTDEEKKALKYECFVASDMHYCIYGQMTGHCNNLRALEILRLSSINHSTYHLLKLNCQEISNIEEKPKWDNHGSDSPLEAFLMKCDSSTHKDIINYIKGNISELPKLKY